MKRGRFGLALVPVVAASVVATGGPVRANVLIEMSRERKLAEADLVAVATPAECTPIRSADYSYYAPCTLRVVETIKGSPVATLTFNRLEDIAESDVICCQPGHAYLVYLRQGNGKWWSVNGQYGVRDLGPMEKPQ